LAKRIRVPTILLIKPENWQTIDRSDSSLISLVISAELPNRMLLQVRNLEREYRLGFRLLIAWEPARLDERNVSKRQKVQTHKLKTKLFILSGRNRRISLL